MVEVKLTDLNVGPAVPAARWQDNVLIRENRCDSYKGA